MSINNRLYALRKTVGESQTAFAEKLGVSRGIIVNLESGVTTPKPQFVDLVAKLYHVNAAWLRTGEGEMFMKKSREEEIADFVGRSLADDSGSFKTQFISILAQLDEDGWKALERASEALLEAERKAKAKYGESGDREV